MSLRTAQQLKPAEHSPGTVYHSSTEHHLLCLPDLPFVAIYFGDRTFRLEPQTPLSTTVYNRRALSQTLNLFVRTFRLERHTPVPAIICTDILFLTRIGH